MVRDIAIIVAVFLVGLVSGWFGKSCPKPPDPKPIIQEVEVIRYKEKPVIKEVVKNVKELVKVPYYSGECFDDSGVRALNDLVRGTAAGRADPRTPASAPAK